MASGRIGKDTMGNSSWDTATGIMKLVEKLIRCDENSKPSRDTTNRSKSKLNTKVVRTTRAFRRSLVRGRQEY
jgi:hypothetical protein